MKKDNFKTNFAFQMFYQIVTLVIPLVIAPYLTRTLGENALGIYSYTYSIAFCFMTFARLGIDKYGQRLIASVRDNEQRLRKEFWSLYVIHVIFTIFALLLYIVLINIFRDSNYYVYLAQGIAIIGVAFDITWLYYGLENFKLIVIGNLCVKLVELFLIFALVKNSNDIIIYTIIMSFAICLGYIIVLPYTLKHIKFIKIEFSDLTKHIKPLLILFIAVIANTAYQIIDKTLLGILSSNANVAYYEYANKIVNVPVNLIHVMGTVLMPRACAYAAKGDQKDQVKFLNYSMHFVGFLGFGMMFGLMGVAKLFSVIYYGTSFEYCGKLMMILSPVIVLLGFENILRTQYMIPNHMDKQFTACILLSDVVNLISSATLIRIIGAPGAVIGTLIAESICCIVQTLLCKDFVSTKTIAKILSPYCIAGLIMYLVITLVKHYYNTSPMDLILQIIVGGCAYSVICTVYLFFVSDIKITIRNAIKHKLKRSNDKK